MQNQPFFARPVHLLRAEALCVLLASCAAYHLLFPHHWIKTLVRMEYCSR